LNYEPVLYLKSSQNLKKKALGCFLIFMQDKNSVV
jgi:hypothetical protein